MFELLYDEEYTPISRPERIRKLCKVLSGAEYDKDSTSSELNTIYKELNLRALNGMYINLIHELPEKSGTYRNLHYKISLEGDLYWWSVIPKSIHDTLNKRNISIHDVHKRELLILLLRPESYWKAVEILFRYNPTLGVELRNYIMQTSFKGYAVIGIFSDVDFPSSNRCTKIIYTRNLFFPMVDTCID